jgi:hypothetical protein
VISVATVATRGASALPAHHRELFGHHHGNLVPGRAAVCAAMLTKALASQRLRSRLQVLSHQPSFSFFPSLLTADGFDRSAKFTITNSPPPNCPRL